ncbi:MAG: hypothetical protein HW386_936 [Gammaproteobacteria bacterium]|nr:hypothetical protein [Gammaproteobacteria bacterium]
MEYVLFTLLALILYLAADWILQGIERHYQHRLAQREVVFLLILAVLAIAGFTLVRSLNLA